MHCQKKTSLLPIMIKLRHGYTKIIDCTKKMPVLIFESNAQIECALQNGYSEDQIELLPNFTPIMDKQQIKELHKPVL